MEELLNKKDKLLVELEEINNKIEEIKNRETRGCYHLIVYKYVIKDKKIYECKICKKNFKEGELKELKNSKIIERIF